MQPDRLRALCFDRPRHFGIGGDEYSFRKIVDQIQLGNFIIKDIPIDFGVSHEDINYITGLIGLDILKSGNMIIDLHRMEMYPANPNPSPTLLFTHSKPL
jgi:hypothetical protein